MPEEFCVPVESGGTGSQTDPLGTDSGHTTEWPTRSLGSHLSF